MHSYGTAHAMVTALPLGKDISVPTGLVEPRTGLDTVMAIIFRYETHVPQLLVQFLLLPPGYRYV
jgi:hypothetical protein